MPFTNSLSVGGGGGGGATLTTVSSSFDFTSAMGPEFTTAAGPVVESGQQVGSLYRDSSNGDIYLKTSAGWGVPVGSAPDPFISGNGAPQAFTGVDGDYYLDLDYPAVYGPKAGGAWPAGTPLAAWTMVALAGATPIPAEGVEGDWGWSNDGTYIRIYGPKSSAGWPTEYSRYLAAGIDTGKISLSLDPGFTGADEIRVVPGSGQVYNNGSPTTIASYNGYCTWRRYSVVPGTSVGANSLLIGAELVTDTATSSSGTPIVTGRVGSTVMGLTSTSGFTSYPGLYASTGVTSRTATAQSFSAGGAVTIDFFDVNFGNYLSLANITALKGTVKFYFLTP